jgi:hypothetical protein
VRRKIRRTATGGSICSRGEGWGEGAVSRSEKEREGGLVARRVARWRGRGPGSGRKPRRGSGGLHGAGQREIEDGREGLIRSNMVVNDLI